MKLDKDPTARARLRMLRPWLTADQYREVCAGLKDVEAPARGELRQRLVARFCAACKAFVAHVDSMVSMLGRRGAQSDGQRLHR